MQMSVGVCKRACARVPIGGEIHQCLWVWCTVLLHANPEPNFGGLCMHTCSDGSSTAHKQRAPAVARAPLPRVPAAAAAAAASQPPPAAAMAAPRAARLTARPRPPLARGRLLTPRFSPARGCNRTCGRGSSPAAGKQRSCSHVGEGRAIGRLGRGATGQAPRSAYILLPSVLRVAAPCRFLAPCGSLDSKALPKPKKGHQQTNAPVAGGLALAAARRRRRTAHAAPRTPRCRRRHLPRPCRRRRHGVTTR